MNHFGLIFIILFCLIVIVGFTSIIISLVFEKDFDPILPPIIKERQYTIEDINLDFEYNTSSVILSEEDDNDNSSITIQL